MAVKFKNNKIYFVWKPNAMNVEASFSQSHCKGKVLGGGMGWATKPQELSDVSWWRAVFVKRIMGEATGRTTVSFHGKTNIILPQRGTS